MTYEGSLAVRERVVKGLSRALQQDLRACGCILLDGTATRRDRIGLCVPTQSQLRSKYYDPVVLTECTRAPAAHHRAKPLNDLTSLNRPSLGLCLLDELSKSSSRDLVASELRKEFLLGGQIEILVRLNLFLKERMSSSSLEG